MFRTITVSAIASLLSACVVLPLPTKKETDSGKESIGKTCDCVAECNALGYGCLEATACTCGDTLNQACADGSDNVCSCLAHLEGYSCSNEDWEAYYTTCYKSEAHPAAEEIACFSAYYPPDECELATIECLQ